MRILHPTPWTGGDHEVAVIVDFRADGPFTFNGSALLDLSIGYLRTDGVAAEHRGHSYELNSRDCLIVQLVDGTEYVTSRPGAAAYLRRCLQPPMIELE